MYWGFADFEEAYDPTDMQDLGGLKTKKIVGESRAS